jgi:NAD(P)-dependent dehydrogenase (short-subunit alcohol dehydrogenase family)
MSQKSPHTTVLLIGASRGLGLAMAEEYLNHGSQVVATVRGAERTELHNLQDTAGERLEIEHTDITIPEEIVDLHDRLTSRTFDLLFVNAGITQTNPEDTIADISTEEFARLMVTNALSPMRVIETLEDLVAPTGTIAAMSSGQGSIANNERGGFEVYRAPRPR